MTNREESSAAEHETYPGPGPLKADEAKRGIRPVEQMVDAAIERVAAERIARETQARAARAGSAASGSATATRAEQGHALTLARSDAAELMAMHEASVGSELALATEGRGKGRLRWKGLDVSDEFRNYAERVARGEDLPPFTGKILAEPDPAFPWDPTAQKRAARQALKKQVGLWVGVAAFLGLSVAVLILQVRKQADSWQAAESPLATVSMANQPSTESSPSSAGVSTAVAANAPAAFNESGQEPAAPASAAAAAVDDRALGEPLVATTTPAPAVAPTAVAVAPPAAAAVAPRPAAAKVAPPAAASSGVFVATRAPAPVAGSGTPVSASTASEPALKAVGTGGTAAGSSVTAATDVAGAGDSASALRADPKKEPTREASGMGSLLVESPSF